jgi:hypothetical protein
MLLLGGVFGPIATMLSARNNIGQGSMTDRERREKPIHVEKKRFLEGSYWIFGAILIARQLASINSIFDMPRRQVFHGWVTDGHG